jgi:hypothetical protein
MSEQRLPIHPYAEIFPPMNFPDFDRLCGDIQQNGLQEDIVLLDGKVLDGRSRYLACLARGMTPRFRPYAGECGSPLAFVIARNLHRRHLTESQRALVAARLKPLFEEEARQRQIAGLKRGSDLPVGENSPQREKHAEKRRSAQKAAELMQVSDFSVKAADKVHKQGVEPLVAAVAEGKVSVSAAARIAALPAEQQQTEVARLERGLKGKQSVPQVQGTPAACVDDDGRPLPDQVLPAFRQRPRLDQLSQRIDAVARQVERLKTSPVAAHLNVEAASCSLRAVGRTLAAARPSRLCPHPADSAADCPACGGHGWIPAAKTRLPPAGGAPCAQDSTEGLSSVAMTTRRAVASSRQLE